MWQCVCSLLVAGRVSSGARRNVGVWECGMCRDGGCGIEKVESGKTPSVGETRKI